MPTFRNLSLDGELCLRDGDHAMTNDLAYASGTSLPDLTIAIGSN